MRRTIKPRDSTTWGVFIGRLFKKSISSEESIKKKAFVRGIFWLALGLILAFYVRSCGRDKAAPAEKYFYIKKKVPGTKKVDRLKNIWESLIAGVGYYGKLEKKMLNCKRDDIGGKK